MPCGSRAEVRTHAHALAQSLHARPEPLSLCPLGAERCLNFMLTLQLLLSVGTPLVLKFGLYRHATFVDWKESGTSMATSLLFLVIFVIMGFSGAVGLLAVCMQRTGSLVLTILMQMGTAATTVTALACSVVYIEVSRCVVCAHA